MSPMLERWLRELRRHHLDTEVDASLGSLTVQIDGGTASVGRTRGVPLFSSPPVQVETARVEPGIYGGTPTSEARVRLLAAAAAFGRRVLVHAPTVTDGTYRGRLAIDLPRRAMHALGRSTAEPGDRFDERFVHTFFDDEPIIGEARRANLAFVGRERGWIILEQSIGRPEERAESFALELMRALRFVRAAEHLRRVTNPEHAVMTMRARGERTKARGAVGRARLRRAVGWVDAGFPGGPNCFRRALVEIGLDAGAAHETLVFGLDVGRTGHVAFKDTEERTFDVAFEIGPSPAMDRARLTARWPDDR